jgi:hypothetical protein
MNPKREYATFHVDFAISTRAIFPLQVTNLKDEYWIPVPLELKLPRGSTLRPARGWR